MKTAGIIAEYNPFHNGHQYHIEKTKALTGADYLIVVMSGDFLQRGVPACIDKYTRARMALSCGADLVLELPLYYAAGSAEYFAAGAVALLDKLGIVDAVCFGSECGDIAALSETARLLLEEPAGYQAYLQSALKSGRSYPAARRCALSQYLSDVKPHHTQVSPALLHSPNNILGIEYCKALLKRNSRIVPYTIKREGGGYHDTVLSQANSSAQAIRLALEAPNEAAQTPRPIKPVQEHMPEAAYALLQDVYGVSTPVTADDISLLLHYQLLSYEAAGYTQFLDVSEELSHKIVKNLRYYKNFTDFCNLLKTKDLTHTRISRALLHILLSVTKEHMSRYQAADYILYARILGFRRNAAPLLSHIKQAGIPLISKLADAGNYLSDTALAMLDEDIRAAHIYNAVIQHKYHTLPANEYRTEIVIL